MPSTLESLVAHRLPWVLGIAALYIIALLALTRQRFRRAVGLAAIALAFHAAGSTGLHGVTAAQVQDPEESVRRLVVRVESAIGFGSGIIVGARSDTLFIATANHVVRRGQAAADSVDLRFYWRPDVPVQATLLPLAADSLDLAVLAVFPLSAVPADSASPAASGDRRSAAPVDLRAIPFDRLGDLDALARGDPIWLLGQPNGLPWRINTSPEQFIGFRGESLDFESNLLARGHSGGALLNEDREVIGMLKSDQAPYGEAVSMYAIARQLEAWGYPVDLELRPPQLEPGRGRTCVLTSRGDTRCVGFDDRYERGPIDLDMRLRRLSMRDDHACGIAAGGRAFCVGPNANGQLGDGTTVSRYDSPAEVAGGLAFQSISAGSGHTCGIVQTGDVYCWGLDEGGQLGSPFDGDRTTPVRVPVTGPFRTVSAIWQYTCGLTTAGEAWCWGAVAGNSFLRRSSPARYAPDLTFVALTAGWYQFCGITAAGRAYCQGFNENGELGTGSPDDGFHEEPMPVAGDHAFTSITSGVMHTCGLTLEGQAWCWGSNDSGQLGNGTTAASAVPVRVSGGHAFEAVSAGGLHTCGLTPDGEVWCWGYNRIVASHEGGGVLPDGEELYTEPVRTLTLDPDDRRPWRR
jgi:S1-C subfamily serine protease